MVGYSVTALLVKFAAQSRRLSSSRLTGIGLPETETNLHLIYLAFAGRGDSV
jgi:hypothetical protein